MKIREFLYIVPRSFKITAWAFSACCMVAGGVMVAIHVSGRGDVPGMPESLGLCLVAAALVSAWILCLGYVHADARRRSMPPWLWTWIVAFMPNLLGFLLYFACRRPIALPCPHCGRPTKGEQRFCSWCGQPPSAPLASEGMLA